MNVAFFKFNGTREKNSEFYIRWMHIFVLNQILNSKTKIIRGKKMCLVIFNFHCNQMRTQTKIWREKKSRSIYLNRWKTNSITVNMNECSHEKKNLNIFIEKLLSLCCLYIGSTGPWRLHSANVSSNDPLKWIHDSWKWLRWWRQNVHFSVAAWHFYSAHLLHT